MEVRAIGSATRHIARELLAMARIRGQKDKRNLPNRKSCAVGKLSSEAIDLACGVNAIVLQKYLRPYGYPAPRRVF
jgi:hypothetical protein